MNIFALKYSRVGKRLDKLKIRGIKPFPIGFKYMQLNGRLFVVGGTETFEDNDPNLYACTELVEDSKFDEMDAI